MQVDGAPQEFPPVQQEAQMAIDAAEVDPLPMTRIARDDFYEKAKRAYAVILTGERRFYGTLRLRKGVIDPPG